MQIGPYKISILTLGHFRMDGGGLFGIIPKKLWIRAYPHADDDNRVLMSARALLIVGNGAVLVADAGLGEKLDEKARSIFCVDQPADAIGTALALHGLKPTDVTHYIFTHLHFDHAGGATSRDNSGAVLPTFPCAQHFVQSRHLEWANNPSDKDRASFNSQNWEPVRDAGLLNELDGTSELLPGIELLPVDGHTPAMQMVLVREGDTGLVYTIDLFPTRAHLSPHYVAAFDNLPLQALNEKKALLARALDQNWIVCFGHDNQVAGVSIRQAQKGYEVEASYSVDELNA